MCWFQRFLSEFFILLSDNMFFKCSSLIWSSIKSALVHQQTRIINIIAFKVFQAISEFVRGNMEPCRWKFDRILVRGISKQQKWEMRHTRLNNLPVFRNYRDIDFALRCVDVLATNAQISMNWNLMFNFVKLKQRIVKRHPTSYWPNVGVGNLEKF